MATTFLSTTAGPSRSPMPGIPGWLPPFGSRHHATSPAFDHPHAPLPPDWKGKARAAQSNSDGKPATDEDVRALQTIRQSLQAARGIVCKGYGEAPKSRSGQNLRGVVQSETPLQSLSAALASLPAASGRISPLDPLTLLPPIEALTALSRALGLDAFIEDSQFGLLKTSLSLAGGTCVVDVDLEVDALDGADGAEGADEDDEMGEGSRRPSTQLLGAASTPTASGSGRGPVRLSKLSLNYQTPSDAATDPSTEGKSDWIAEVLREQVGRYVDVWNESAGRARRREIAVALRRVKDGLRELKEVDDAVKAQGRNWFAELDKAVVDFGGMCQDSEALLRPTKEKNVFPTFHLLPPASESTRKDSYAPAVRFRPVYPDELASTLPLPATSMAGTEHLLGEGWVLELAEAGEGAGLVVRPSWLDEETQHPAGNTGWDGPLRVEQLLYNPLAPSFPYLSEFSVQSPHIERDLTWSIACPGPHALLVGRVALPTTRNGVQHVLRILRRQIVLNTLFRSVFRPAALASPQDSPTDEQDDTEMDLAAMLTGALTELAITVSLGPDSIDISFPVSRESAPGSVPTTLIITLRSAMHGPPTTLIEASARVSPQALDSRAIEDSVVRAISSSGEVDLALLLAAILRELKP